MKNASSKKSQKSSDQKKKTSKAKPTLKPKSKLRINTPPSPFAMEPFQAQVQDKASKKFPIVGIAGSAGGLKVFREILSLLPSNTGMGFIIIQHLSPNFNSFSAEILSRVTKMPVREATEGIQVEPNHVYVIPPNCKLGIAHGILHVSERTAVRGRYLPADYLFQTLAQDLGPQAVGIVLSGTNSDGAEGLRAIKATNGIALVQDPTTAEFDGMPMNAIASGVVDLILNPKAIAEELIELANHPFASPFLQGDNRQLNEKKGNLETIFRMLESSAGVDFNHYKHSTIRRRIARRMLLLKINDLTEYTKYLKSNPSEVKSLFADILIHVTSFFRDPKVFESLKTRILPKIIKTRNSSLPFRVWIPGCSTGEEAYSLAMVLLEFIEEYRKTSKVNIQLNIFATDISEQALQKARLGIYPASIAHVITKTRLKRFFERLDGGDYKIAKWVRETCLFSRHDVTRDPPFAKVDIISCRNLLIYFDSELQHRVVPIFHYSLNPNGILILGRAETIGGFANIFQLSDKANKVYSKKNGALPLKIQFPIGRHSVEKLVPGVQITKPLLSRVDLKKESEQIILSEYAPPGVIVNDSLEIVHSHGRLAPFLEFPPGQPSFNLLRMAHLELITELKSLIQAARKKDHPIKKENISITCGNNIIYLSIKVIPRFLPHGSKDRYFCIFFEEGTTKEYDLLKRTLSQSHKSKNIKLEPLEKKQLERLEKIQNFEMRKKLSDSREYQQSLIEEYETSQGELISSNEELQSANEELQSTNEELETAKEELQSTNEELTTVNEEIQTRNAEMLQLNNDLANLLSSTDIPLIMLGRDGRIRRYTPKAGQTFKLVPGDLGKPIGEIQFQLELPKIEKLVDEVISTKTIKELDTQDVKGHWYRLQIRPYLTIENKTEGALIVLLDIDHLKRAAEEIKRNRDDILSIIESQPFQLLVIEKNMRVRLASKSFYSNFKLAPASTEGQLFYELDHNEWNIPELVEKIHAVFEYDQQLEKLEVSQKFSRIGFKTMFLSLRRLHLPGSETDAALLTIEDVTDQKIAEMNLSLAEKRYRNLLETANDGVMILDARNKIEFANKQLKKIFGYQTGELIGNNFEILIPDRLKNSNSYNHLQYVTQPKHEKMIASLEMFGRHKSGIEIPIEISLSPARIGTELYTTAIIRDISSRKKIEKDLADLMALERQARAEAEKANRAKDDFLATLSHELRTPLTSILSWAQMLRLGKLDAEKTKHGILILEKSAKAQGQLINDLLDVSRIQSGKLILNITTMDPSVAVRSTIESVRAQLEDKLIKIDTHIDPAAGNVIADPDRLQQILWNLLTNAVKFTSKKGNISIHLCRIRDSKGEHIKIQVSDTGKGIKPEFLPHIFDRFSQADSSSTRIFGGLGLGLAIVRNLTEMQGGRVEASSLGEGKGATFTIILPCQANLDTQALKPLEKSEYDSSSRPVRLDGLRILVVDDDANAREIFAVMLQTFGAKVTTADSVSEALKVFSQTIPDILLSDIAMPDQDGYSLIRKIRSLQPDAGGSIPAIAITAYAGGEDIHQAIYAGFNGHLAKPVDAIKLTALVSELIAQKNNSRPIK